MGVRWHPEAEKEALSLPAKERAAIDTAIMRLQLGGLGLGHPHSSAVYGSGAGVRELRPRRDDSLWRVFSRRVHDTFVILAIGPEAKVNPRGFDRAIADAEHRLSEIVED